MQSILTASQIPVLVISTVPTSEFVGRNVTEFEVHIPLINYESSKNI